MLKHLLVLFAVFTICSCQNCQDVTFDLIKDLGSRTDRLQMLFFFKLSSSSASTTTDLERLARSCLQDIGYVLKPISGSQSETVYVGVNYTRLNRIQLSIQGAPLTQYKISFGYRKFNSGLTLTLSDIPTAACFDAPSKPRDVISTKNSDGSITVTWKEPEAINAPKLSYYRIEKRTKESAIFSKLEDTLRTNIQISKDDLPLTYIIRISAFNERSFYNDNPAIINCTNQIEGSEVVDLIVSNFQTTTTKKPVTSRPGSASSVALNLILFFSSLILSIYALNNF
jgi:hypothetical protein